MCGILSIINYRNSDIDSFQSALSDMGHRGPDSSGFFRNHAVLIGHKRLSILETSDKGSQPMLSNCGRYILSFNGEIYNHIDIRNEYLKDVSFVSNSDTETLLQFLITYGDSHLYLLNGMFAFVFLDLEKNKVIVARDHLGIKPLYYWKENNRYIFSSSLLSFRHFAGVKNRLNKDELETYFTYQTASTGNTLLKGVKSLELSSVLIIENEEVVIRAIDYYKDIQDNSGIRETIRQSVEMETLSDVPLVTFLSAGIDSTIVTGIISELKQDLCGLTIGYEATTDLDESAVAAITANHLDIEHKIHYQGLANLSEEVLNIYRSFDSPSPDGINVFLVSRFAKSNRRKVAITGIGGDEIFGGYRSTNIYNSIIGRLFRFKMIRKVYTKLPRMIRLKTFTELSNSRSSPEDYVFSSRKMLSYEQKRIFLNNTILSNGHLKRHESSLYDRLKGIKDPFTRINFTELYLYTSPLLLKDTDQASMLSSIEVRVPLLNRNMVSLLLNHQGNLYKGKGKQLLKNLFKSYFVERTWGRKKTGFYLPWSDWLRSDLSQDVLCSLDFLCEKGILNEEIKEEFYKYLNSRSKMSNTFWLSCLSLVQWIKTNRIEVP